MSNRRVHDWYMLEEESFAYIKKHQISKVRRYSTSRGEKGEIYLITIVIYVIFYGDFFQYNFDKMVKGRKLIKIRVESIFQCSPAEVWSQVNKLVVLFEIASPILKFKYGDSLKLPSQWETNKKF